MSNHVGFVVIPLWNENVISSEPWYIMQQRGTHTHTRYVKCKVTNTWTKYVLNDLLWSNPPRAPQTFLKCIRCKQTPATGSQTLV